MSVLTIGELEHGVQAGSTPAVAELRRHTLTLASLFEVAPLDDVLGPRCSGLISSQVSARRIGMIDRWILATAVVRDCTLVTEDRDLHDRAAEVDWRAHAWEPPTIELVSPTVPPRQSHPSTSVESSSVAAGRSETRPEFHEPPVLIHERDRYQLHQALETNLGPENAAILMAHLPPVGWADVATKHDLYALEERLELRMDGLEHRVFGEIAGVRTEMAELGGNLRTEICELGGNLQTELQGELRSTTILLIGANIAIVGAIATLVNLF